MGDCERVSFATLRAKNQLTLPAEISRAAHLSEGDPIEIRYFEGVITLIPKKMVDASQAWFWSADWLQGEREASANIAREEVASFESDDDFLKSLE
jgi:AbrB family looped-hinge helix DNA binding protein